jgi:hypothetical protein
MTKREVILEVPNRKHRNAGQDRRDRIGRRDQNQGYRVAPLFEDVRLNDPASEFTVVD